MKKTGKEKPKDVPAKETVAITLNVPKELYFSITKAVATLKENDQTLKAGERPTIHNKMIEMLEMQNEY